MKFRYSTRIYTVFVLLLVLFSSQIVKIYSANTADASPRIICRKTELWEVKYAPTGKLLETSVYVRFEIYNNSSFPICTRVVDRIGHINASTFSALYGTPQPTKMEKFGNITRIVWENVTIEARKTVRYYYSAESLKLPPVAVNMTMLVDGKPADITETELIYFTHANLSDTISFQITLRNTLQPLYIAENRTAVQPLFCTVSLALSNDYFSGIRTSPKANSTSSVADKTVMTWMTFLGNASQTLEASADVIDVGSWGEVTIDPITVQISSSSETLETYFESMTNSLGFSIELMENFIASSDDLGSQTYQMSKALEEIAEVTEEMENTSLLVDTLLLASSSLHVADSMLNQSQTYLTLANSSLTKFITNDTTVEFLTSNPDLRIYLNHTTGNLTLAYALLDMVRNGNGTVPGLTEIASIIQGIAQNITLAGTAMQNVTMQLNELAGALYMISANANQTKTELEPSLNELRKEKTSLEDVLLTFNSKAPIPFDLEIQFENKTEPSLETKPLVEKLEDNAWTITAINVSNPANHSRIIYGFTVQIKSADTFLKPEIQVYVDEKWESPEIFQLGLNYDPQGEILYVLPWIRLNGSSSANVLVDWAGRPLRLKVKCEDKPTVNVSFDFAELLENVEVADTEGQNVYSLVQPHLIVENFTAPEPPQPPPESEKSLFDIITGYLQKPETWLVMVLSITLAVIWYQVIKKIKKERKIRVMREKAAGLEEEDVQGLLKEIEELEKSFKD